MLCPNLELGRRDFFKAGIAGIAAPGAGASQAAPKPSVYNRIEAHLFTPSRPLMCTTTFAPLTPLRAT